MTTCRDCKWAAWEMTGGKRPRILKQYAGDCMYPINAEAIRKMFPLSIVDAHIPSYKHGIDYNDNRICPVAEPKGKTHA